MIFYLQLLQVLWYLYLRWYCFTQVPKKLLDVAPFNISTDSARENIVKISVKNGTKTKGLAAKMEEIIKKEYPEEADILIIVGEDKSE